MSSTDPFAVKPLALVRPSDLYDLFQEVVGIFAFSSCSYIGRPNVPPTDCLEAEYTIKIQGPVVATVVLRSTMAAARGLAQGVSLHEPREDAESLDALKELANLFAGHLMTSCLGGKHQVFEPFLPIRSRPSDWPAREADAACALLLESEAVELRYWQEPRS